MIGYDGPQWTCHFWFVGWHCWSLGVHFDIKAPHIQVHIPFGFITIGRKGDMGSFYKYGWHFKRNMNCGGDTEIFQFQDGTMMSEMSDGSIELKFHRAVQP